MAILSKTWWRSLVKGDGGQDGHEDGGELSGDSLAENGDLPTVAIEEDSLFADLENTGTELKVDQAVEEGESELAQVLPTSRGRNGRNHRDGRRGRREPREDGRSGIPVRAKVASAKDFFSEEAVYRYDIMLPPQREELKGEYRVEVKGNKGGVWSIKVDTGLEIVNRREEAGVVISIQQRDFIQLVNGELNPQMAILAQKMKVVGDLRSVTTLQSLLVPPGYD